MSQSWPLRNGFPCLEEWMAGGQKNHHFFFVFFGVLLAGGFGVGVEPGSFGIFSPSHFTSNKHWPVKFGGFIMFEGFFACFVIFRFSLLESFRFR